MREKIVLVAGASSGLGRATAECLARAGHTVYAGARSFARGVAAPEGCEALSLDVTSDESVRGAVETIVRRHGRLDALVCCAASFTMSPAEELPLAVFEQMLRVNVLGMARCAQAALPVMRAQKSGQIFLFSSLNGLFSIPFQGAYSATKHAVEAFGQALAQETRGMGVTVTLVEPGDCRGGSERYRGKHIAPDSPYAAAFARGTAHIARDEAGGLPPERVGRAVARAAGKKRPPARLIVASPLQRCAVWAFRLLPRRLFDAFIAFYYR